ncbi:MAG: 2-amino-4-hydroxy-6-hydroxymethyldihydropteridine diphosphokinase [candidate division WOR-3 bacterium]|nr:MAG: 2-amino-4-hydroxy-6-hydroxymethyldihydropteridine diphosphokinase [candidate division WOR-3 bacterium]
MAQVLLGLGSNLGNRLANLENAVAALATLGPVRRSCWFETEPVGPELAGEPAFLNGAVALDTDLGPAELLERILGLERELGREPGRRSGSRTIDIDILLAGDRAYDRDGLRVPHPRMHERAFVLVPLSEIAADAVHPGTGRSVREMLDEVDCSVVKRFRAR